MTPVHQRLETPTETSEMKWHLIQIWSATSRSIDRSVTRLFYCVSQSQKQTLWTFAMMCLSMLCNCHDLKLTLLLLWTNGLTFRFTRRVRTVVRRGGQFCRSFVANLLKYPCAKNYENIMRFDKVIAKIIRVQFLPHRVFNTVGPKKLHLLFLQ